MEKSPIVKNYVSRGSEPDNFPAFIHHTGATYSYTLYNISLPKRHQQKPMAIASPEKANDKANTCNSGNKESGKVNSGQNNPAIPATKIVPPL